MFTSITDTDVKELILTSVRNVDSQLRIIISTIAFGMGVHCPSVHFGSPSDTESYFQEAGHAVDVLHLCNRGKLINSSKGNCVYF